MNQVSRIPRLFRVILAGTALLLIFFAGAIISRPTGVTAQEPTGDSLPLPPVNQALLSEFGLTAADLIQASAVNLSVIKTTDVISVTAGDTVTFRISITNQGSEEAFGVFFYDNFPDEMINVDYAFSAGAGAVHNSAADPKDYIWLLGNGIPVGEAVIITVTGELTSARNVTVTNVAKAYGYSNPTTVYQGAAEVGIRGYDPDSPLFGSIYFPSLFKAPPPPPIELIYHEDFSSSDAWIEFDNWNNCRGENRDGRYWVDLEASDRTCLPPARNEPNPERPYRTYGEFEVMGYHSEGLSDAAYGIFINGEGDDNYYLFRIWPNNGCSQGGGWQLIRRKDGSSTTMLQQSCNTAIKREGEHNILRIAHKNDRSLKVYVNGRELGRVTESTSNHLTGTGTGVYVRSDNEDIRIKFDDFKVYKYN